MRSSPILDDFTCCSEEISISAKLLQKTYFWGLGRVPKLPFSVFRRILAPKEISNAASGRKKISHDPKKFFEPESSQSLPETLKYVDTTLTSKKDLIKKSYLRKFC